MNKLLKPSAILLLLGAAFQVQAMTSEELFAAAMDKGSASGVLTGNVADRLKKETRSTEPTHASLVRGDLTADGCQYFKLTLTQPKVPTRDGGFAGDYTTVSKVHTCKDDRETPPVLLDCKVGPVSCMPPR